MCEQRTAEELVSSLDTADGAEEAVICLSVSDGPQDLPDPQIPMKDVSASSAGTTDEDPAINPTVQFVM